jgi:ABC-2 type transport system ATP-binding protein
MERNAIIQINHVNKSFKELKAVNDLSVDIFQGEYVALLGPNGAGKTTLIEMIEGIQRPDSGSITIMGMQWGQHDHKLHYSIGLSLQETKFIDKLTTAETLDLFGSFYDLPASRTDEVLDMVNLQSKRKTFTVNLSGGQRQRLAIGIALLNNPKILLLDEPTTGLDPAARREIWKILQTLREQSGTTMILTTHYMEEAEFLCERILIMDKGSFIAAGTLSELNARHGEGDLIDISFETNFDIQELGISGIKKLDWKEGNTRARIFVDSIAEVLPGIITAAKARNIKVSELSSRKMTLDDLFISMTGRHLHE